MNGLWVVFSVIVVTAIIYFISKVISIAGESVVQALVNRYQWAREVFSLKSQPCGIQVKNACKCGHDCDIIW